MLGKHGPQNVPPSLGTYYYTAKNKLFSDFIELLEFNGKLGTGLRDDKRHKEFATQIAKVIRYELIWKLHGAKYVSMMLGGSPDKADAKELILFTV
jgi:hypothetical protein